MSIDSSLKSKGKLAGRRSVMNRAERIARLEADKKFDREKDKPIGLPKTRVRE